MTFNDLIQYFGTQKAIAAALGVSQPAVSNWSTRGQVPSFQQLRAEAVTRKKLRADSKILKEPKRYGTAD